MGYATIIHMNTQNFDQPQKLIRYSFQWSQVRLLIASLALFIGGRPPIFLIFNGSPAGIVWFLLQLCWLISGLASLYLLYSWNKNGRKLFGVMVQNDRIAFFISVISGVNLGLAALVGNIGMRFSTNYLIFVIVGTLYIVSALYLQKRWKQSGEKLF